MFYERRLITPIPVLLKMSSSPNPLFGEIKRVGTERQNAGKLAKNY